MDLSFDYLIGSLPHTMAGGFVRSSWTHILFTRFLSINWDRPGLDRTEDDWSNALDLFGAEIIGHTWRVSELTVRLSRLLEIPDEAITQFYRGAVLHDIGKIGIPNSILQKAGPLTPEEWSIMRQHPVIAYEMLSDIPVLVPALDIPYYHHEKWNGAGYPIGLKTTEIPLAARVFSVADVWDAITTDRPYRKAWPVDQALDYIRRESERSFDPSVVEVFTELYESGQLQIGKPA